MIELHYLKKFRSVNYSLESLIWVPEAHIVSNIDANGNEKETFGAYTGQIRHFGE